MRTNVPWFYKRCCGKRKRSKKPEGSGEAKLILGHCAVVSGNQSEESARGFSRSMRFAISLR